MSEPEYLQITIQDDRCPVLEGFLETSAHDLTVPQEIRIMNNPILQSCARASIATMETIEKYLPHETEQHGLMQFSKRLRALGSIQSEEHTKGFSILYDEIGNACMEPAYRKLRTALAHCSVVINASTTIAQVVQSTRPAGLVDIAGTLAIAVCCVATGFSAMARTMPQEMRQKTLDRLVRIHVKVTS